MPRLEGPSPECMGRSAANGRRRAGSAPIGAIAVLVEGLTFRIFITQRSKRCISGLGRPMKIRRPPRVVYGRVNDTSTTADVVQIGRVTPVRCNITSLECRYRLFTGPLVHH